METQAVSIRNTLSVKAEMAPTIRRWTIWTSQMSRVLLQRSMRNYREHWINFLLFPSRLGRLSKIKLSWTGSETWQEIQSRSNNWSSGTIVSQPRYMLTNRSMKCSQSSTQMIVTQLVWTRCRSYSLKMACWCLWKKLQRCSALWNKSMIHCGLRKVRQSKSKLIPRRNPTFRA